MQPWKTLKFTTAFNGVFTLTVSPELRVKGYRSEGTRVTRLLDYNYKKQ